MPKKKHRSEEIITKLREADILLWLSGRSLGLKRIVEFYK